MRLTRSARFARRAVPAICAVVALATSGCDMFEPKDPGERIYRKLCSSCHGIDGRGNTVRYMSNDWADLTDNSWKTYGDDGSIETTIREGVFGQMPARPELTREEMSALLGYLRKLRGETSE
jgi:mono/diheme cytochrome c family protein